MKTPSFLLVSSILLISVLNPIYVKAQNNNIYFSTFFGESLADFGTGVTIDGDGNIYLVGVSDHLIVDEITIDQTASGTPLFENRNIFLNKYSSTGELLSKIIIGGGDIDYAQKVIVDSSGDLIIIGNTRSQDFPVFNSDLTVVDTGEEIFDAVFVTKLSPSGEILWSGILGGSSRENIYAAAIDNNDDILLGINTRSTDFPIIEGSEYNSTTETSQDIVICKLSTSGQLLWSTYLIGNRDDRVISMTVDSDNNIYLTGSSDSVDFPGLVFFENQAFELIIVKYSPQGEFMWSTVTGGDGDDEGIVIAFNPTEESIIVAGITYSRNFPTTENDPVLDDLPEKAFASHVGLSGEIISSYIFARSVRPFDIKISSDGTIYLTGDFVPETIGGTQHDVIINKFSSQGNLRANATLGGQGEDVSLGIVLDLQGRIIIAGYTESVDFPLVNPLDSDLEIIDAFLTIIEDNIVLPTGDESEPTRTRISWTPLPTIAVLVLGVVMRRRSERRNDHQNNIS